MIFRRAALVAALALTNNANAASVHDSNVKLAAVKKAAYQASADDCDKGHVGAIVHLDDSATSGESFKKAVLALGRDEDTIGFVRARIAPATARAPARALHSHEPP